MKTKLIGSTEAQNNFGRVLDDVVQNSTRYVVRRRNSSQVIILSIADFANILRADKSDKEKLERVIREHSPEYNIGRSISE